MQVFRSLTKISVYDILTNNFKVNPSEKLKSKYRIPMKAYFNEICFYYDISNVNETSTVDVKSTVNKKSTVILYNSWSDHFIFFHLLFNALKCLFYTFWNEDNPLIRMIGGNLEQFFGSNILYFAIFQTGASLNCTTTFYLFHYLPVSHLNWLKVFNPIEGKESFVESKIFMAKSAKNLIRFSLIFVIIFSAIDHITPIFGGFYFFFIPFKHITFKQFIFYGVPWALVDTIWLILGCYYNFAGLIILIICYYYELRLNQLDVYVGLNLKRKRFNRINEQIGKILVEYVDVINEINQFNKFVSKLIFFLLLCSSSTLAFIIYNMIYVKIEWIMYILFTVFSGYVSLTIVLIMLSTIQIASKYQRSKRNLIKLNYIKSLKIKNRIKVSCCAKIIIK